MICRKVIYSGRVQGVGFRYRAREAAEGLRVTGYVMNLPDGTVELLAQGDLAEVECLLGRIAESMRANIRETFARDVAPGDFLGFEIRR